jgi:hypothetical protein
MDRRWHALISIGLALTLIVLTGCAGAQPAQTPTAEPQRTARPTFTPSEDIAAEVLPTVTSTPRQSTGDVTATPVTAAPSSTATVAPTNAIKPLKMSSPEYGMQAFLWWRPEVASRDVQVIADAGFGWVKVNFGWRDIEGSKGAFDWSHTDAIVEMASGEGLDILARVDFQPQWSGGGYPTSGPPDDPQDLADFIGALVSRYAGRIRAYQVWNEPNLGREWGGQTPDPGAYVKLLRTAYAAIKQADPNAMVISAGLSPTGTWDAQTRPDDWYLESMYIAMGGSSEGYFDVLGAHGAGYLSPVDGLSPGGGSPRHHGQIRRLGQTDGPARVWLDKRSAA